MQTWSRDMIWWQVYPLGFLGAAPTSAASGAPSGTPSGGPTRSLRDLEPWLDYLIELGANGLALGPIFASETHGYDTVDHFRIDSRLGTDDDFDALVAACRSRGIRVLLDGVFNHVGTEFAAFRDVRAHGRDSAYTSWFHLDFDDADPNGTGRSGTGQSGSGRDGFGYADFEGHSRLVRLNHENPDVASYVTDVMAHWCARGVDGWRLDAAYAIPPGFWRGVTTRLRQQHPDVWLVGEMIHGDYAGYVAESGLDSVTQYELWKAIWSSLNDRNFFELSHALSRHRQLLDTFWPQTFVGNHDVTRIASQVGDPRDVGHALAILFATPGIPSVYYGDEQGLRGVKEDREGGDDAVRPVFPAGPGEVPASGRGGIDLHRELIAVRRRHPWFAAAVPLPPDELTNERLAYRIVDPDERHALLLVLNVADAAATVRLPPPYGPTWTIEAGTGELGTTGVLDDVEAGGGTGASGGGGGSEVTVPGHGWSLLSTDRASEPGGKPGPRGTP